MLTGDTINIMSLIGLIMLMGLVTKNAILLVDYTKVLRRRGIDRRKALILAGRTRLRPILMTTSAMIFGMLPLFFALGEGAEFRAPDGPRGRRRPDHLDAAHADRRAGRLHDPRRHLGLAVRGGAQSSRRPRR